MGTIHFSNHAFDRLKERVQISKEEITNILKYDICINIGSEKRNKHRHHKLFYSVRDARCFVIVQDVKCNSIITVLPIDYHNNVAWEVSIDARLLAEELMVIDLSVPPVNEELGYSRCYAIDPKTIKPKVIHVDEIPSIFRISLDIFKKDKILRKPFGKCPSTKYNNNMELLLKDDTFLESLKIKATQHDWIIDSIVIWLGSSKNSSEFIVYPAYDLLYD
jgi:hypothetical protein